MFFLGGRGESRPFDDDPDAAKVHRWKLLKRVHSLRTLVRRPFAHLGSAPQALPSNFSMKYFYSTKGRPDPPLLPHPFDWISPKVSSRCRARVVSASLVGFSILAWQSCLILPSQHVFMSPHSAMFEQSRVAPCPKGHFRGTAEVTSLTNRHGLLPLRPATSSESSDLESRVSNLLNRSGAEAGICFETPEGRVFEWNADQTFHAASTMKVPVMMEVFRQVESAELRLNDTLAIKNSFASLIDGSPYALSRDDDSDRWIYGQSGKTLSIRILVSRMIDYSSNLATNVLMERISTTKVQQLMTAIGAKDMKVVRGLEDKKAFKAGRNNTTSARSLAICLKAILDPNCFQNNARREMLEILFSQRLNNGIPRGIRARERGLKVAHKTGSITRISHDAAIIEDQKGRHSILVILTLGVPEAKQGEALVAKLAGDVCDALLF